MGSEGDTEYTGQDTARVFIQSNKCLKASRQLRHRAGVQTHLRQRVEARAHNYESRMSEDARESVTARVIRPAWIQTMGDQKAAHDRAIGGGVDDRLYFVFGCAVNIQHQPPASDTSRGSVIIRPGAEPTGQAPMGPDNLPYRHRADPVEHVSACRQLSIIAGFAASSVI